MSEGLRLVLERLEIRKIEDLDTNWHVSISSMAQAAKKLVASGANEDEIARDLYKEANPNTLIRVANFKFTARSIHRHGYKSILDHTPEELCEFYPHSAQHSLPRIVEGNKIDDGRHRLASMLAHGYSMAVVAICRWTTCEKEEVLKYNAQIHQDIFQAVQEFKSTEEYSRWVNHAQQVSAERADWSDSTFKKVLGYVAHRNHHFAHWAQARAIGHEGATSHVKQLMLSLLVVNQSGADMRTPQEVLVYETGFNVGCSASAICEALELTGGKLVSFELDDNKKPVAEQFKSRFPNTEFVWGDSAHTLPSLVDRDRGKVGLFHQDGVHDLKGTKRDIELALEVLKPGGFLVVDDANSDVVKQSVREVIGEGAGLWLLNQTGQFIYQKR